MLKVCSFNLNFTNFTPCLINLMKMKVFTYILIALALGLIIFNVTLLDFQNLFEGNSLIALIGIAASLCAVCILLIFRMSKMIDEKTRGN